MSTVRSAGSGWGLLGGGSEIARKQFQIQEQFRREGGDPTRLG